MQAGKATSDGESEEREDASHERLPFERTSIEHGDEQDQCRCRSSCQLESMREQVHAVRERREHERAEHGADDRAAAAGERGAADDDRGDGVELEQVALVARA